MDWQHAREDLLRNSDVQHLIAERAYLISQRRGFEDGHQIEDWFQAENEVIDYLLREHEAHNDEPPAASALALTDSAIFEEPVAAPIASGEISAEPAPAKKRTAAKRETKSSAPKAKSTASKTRESKSVKTSAPKLKPTLRKASKKPTATNPSSEVGD